MTNQNCQLKYTVPVIGAAVSVSVEERWHENDVYDKNRITQKRLWWGRGGRGRGGLAGEGWRVGRGGREVVVWKWNEIIFLKMFLRKRTGRRKDTDWIKKAILLPP